MLSSNKKMFSDLLFWVQIFFALVFGGGQFIKMLTTTEGVSVTWLIFWEFFNILNLILAYKTDKAEPTRISRQTIRIYQAWTLVIGANIALMFWQGVGIWSERDTYSSILIPIAIAVTVFIALAKRKPLADPMIKGWIAVFCKGIPQLVLAYSIYLYGGEGLWGVAIYTGHVTILTRLTQLTLSRTAETGWDKNRVASLLSEGFNEATWIVVTIIWHLT